MRISDWSSDVCSSDLQVVLVGAEPVEDVDPVRRRDLKPSDDVGERAVEARSVREIVVIAVAHALAQESFDLAAVEAVDRTAEPVGDPLAALDAVVAGKAVRLEEIEIVELRSEERRVGKECVSTCRSRWSP